VERGIASRIANYGVHRRAGKSKRASALLSAKLVESVFVLFTHFEGAPTA
jgi:hypothetical protein